MCSRKCSVVCTLAAIRCGVVETFALLECYAAKLVFGNGCFCVIYPSQLEGSSELPYFLFPFRFTFFFFSFFLIFCLCFVSFSYYYNLPLFILGFHFLFYSSFPFSCFRFFIYVFFPFLLPFMLYPCILRSKVQKFPAWHIKAAPNGKCCEGYIVPSMVRLMYQLKSVLK